jgi:hypothetical protein
MTRLFFTACGIALFASCVTIAPRYYTESRIQSGELARKKSAFFGFSLKFDGIPEELVWTVEFRMKRAGSQKIESYIANGREFVAGKSADRVPVVFHVPAGKYEPVSVVLNFPKQQNTLYATEQESVVLSPPQKLPEVDLASGWMRFVGEVKISGGSFVAGKTNHKTKMNVEWDAYAPIMGTTWQRVREDLRIADLGAYPVSGTAKDGLVPALLMYEKSTDAAFSALSSGFSDSYGIVLVKGPSAGHAFFEDTAGNLLRVRSELYGESHYFALAVSDSDRVNLRGFCFQERDSNTIEAETCWQPRVQEEPLFSRGQVEPGEVRFRGVFTRVGNKYAMDPILHETVALEVEKEIPGAKFRSFVLGDEPRVRKASGPVIFDAKEPRSQWDAASQTFADKIFLKATECDALLRGIDPFVGVAWEVFWEPGEDGKLRVREKSFKGLGTTAQNILVPCLNGEVSRWVDTDKTEIGKGFGVRFR